MTLKRSGFVLALIGLIASGCGGPGPATSSAPPPATAASPSPTNAVGTIERLDPALDALVAPGAAIEKVAGGFQFTEGPLWRPDHTLWFSDVPGNVVRSVTPDGKVTVLIENAGGVSTAPPGSFIGPNGMAEAPDGSVWMVQHGDRRIVRVAPDRTLTPVVSTFEGKRFNSPNDLVFASGRRPLLHRPAVRTREAGRGPGQGTAASTASTASPTAASRRSCAT